MGKCWEGLDGAQSRRARRRFRPQEEMTSSTIHGRRDGGVRQARCPGLHPLGHVRSATHSTRVRVPATYSLRDRFSGFLEGIPSMPAGSATLPEYNVMGGWDMLDFSLRVKYGDVVRKMDEAGAIQLTTVVSENTSPGATAQDAGTDHSGGCQNRTTTAKHIVPHVTP